MSNAGELLLETVDTGQTASGVTRWVKLREDGVFVPVPGSSSRLVGFTARDLPLAASRDGVLKQLLDGQMVPLAGESSAGSSGDGGPGTSAKLQEPSSLATDADGNLFIVDAANWRVRKLSVSGTISTYYVSSDASDLPRFVSTDQHGAVYVASSGLGRVRKFDSVGSIAQVLGGDRPAPRLGEQPAEDTAVSNITGFQADGDGNLILTSLGITGFWQISAETGLIGRRLQGDTYQIVGRNREHGALALRPGVGLFQLTAKLPAAPLIAPEGQMFLGGSYATDPISGSVFYIQASNLMRLDRDGLIHTSVSASDPDNAFAAATPASTPLNIEFNQRGDLFFTDEQHRVKMLTQAASCGEQAVAR